MTDVDFTAHRHPVQAVACPTCKAKVGTYCKRPSGHKAMNYHQARKEEADRVWKEGNFPPIERTASGWRYADA